MQPKEYLAIYAADRVRNLSAVWMGATVGCAQCHDHKFDPYTAKDFYSLAAFFADVDEEKHLRGGGADTVPDEARAGDPRPHAPRARAPRGARRDRSPRWSKPDTDDGEEASSPTLHRRNATRSRRRSGS